MRVVDLRSTADRSPTASCRASSAAELLRTIGVLVDPGPGEYDLGSARVDTLRQSLPEGVRRELERVAAFEDKLFFLLSSLAAELDEPADVDALLALLDRDPARPWWLLVGHGLKHWEAAPATLVDRVTAGRRDARAEVDELVAQVEAPAQLRALLDTDSVELGQRIAAVVAQVREAIWEELEAEAMEPIRRDVEYRRAQLEQGMDIGRLVLEASNGYELPDDPSVRHVELLPTYTMRPWIVIARIGTTEVLATPVADEFLGLPAEAPPPALLKLFKALSDEGRLKLLRRLASGPISLNEAASELGVAKATAHHHLSILRQSGLVSCRGERRSQRYALREDPSAAARAALETYVPPRP